MYVEKEHVASCNKTYNRRLTMKLIVKLLIIMIFVFIPSINIKACIHENRSFIKYIEHITISDLEGFDDFDDYVSKFVTLGPTEVVDEYNSLYEGYIEIYDKATDTSRYEYGHFKMFYCYDCNKQFYTFELCNYNKWQEGTQENYISSPGFSFQGISDYYVHSCECGRFDQSYSYIKVGKYIFSEMPKSCLDVGQVPLDTWKKVNKYDTFGFGVDNYYVKVIKGDRDYYSDSNLDVVYEPFKLVIKSVISKNNFVLGSDIATYRNDFHGMDYKAGVNIASPIKSVSVTSGKQNVKVKKYKKKVKIKCIKNGKATIKIKKKNGAILILKYKIV